MKPLKRKKAVGIRLIRLWLICCLLVLTSLFAVLSVNAAETEAETLKAVPYGTVPDTNSLRENKIPISYGLRVMAAREEMVFSGLCGNEISITAEDICRAMNISQLNFITVMSLPSEAQGTLYIGSVGVSEGQVISAGSISQLSFAAKDDSQPSEAEMTLSVNGTGYAVNCRFCLTDRLNYTPTVSLVPEISLSIETYVDLPTFGTLSSYDPEGDELTYEIIRYATHGRVSLTDRHTGAYTYTPESGYVGSDAFSYVVRDKYGNYSTSAVVSITVSKTPANITYADIEGDMAAASIIRVSEAGIMNGRRVGAHTYFKPTEAISRVEFLVTAMYAAGISAEDVADLSAPSFADAHQIPESMARYVSLAVRRGYIAGKEIDGQLCFCPDETITRAEAAVILSNIIGYAKQTTVTAFADADAMPAWSVKAMNSLKSLGILMPGDGNADARSKMTRGDTAVWLDKTVSVISRGN